MTDGLDPLTDPTLIKPGHTLILAPKGSQGLGFYASTPTPNPQIDKLNIGKVQLYAGGQVWYQTFVEYGLITFKATVKGDAAVIRELMKTVLNKPVNVKTKFIAPCVGWVVEYKPTYQDGYPNATFIEITVQKISDGKI